MSPAAAVSCVSAQSLEVQTVLSMLVSLLVTIPFCYAPAAFVTFLVKERVCKSKRVRSRGTRESGCW